MRGEGHRDTAPVNAQAPLVWRTDAQHGARLVTRGKLAIAGTD